jgi:hypothetical protein
MASKGPTILVLMCGGPVDVTFAKNDPKISAILWVGYPGQAGGTAIADVIFGTTNPGGKLPMTWYPQDYVSKIAMTDLDMRSNPRTGYPGRTYRFYKGPVVFPFGFGLSYGRFTQTLAQAPSKVMVPLSTNYASKNVTMLKNTVRVLHTNCDTPSLSLHIDVNNMGEHDGAHTILVFSTPPGDTQMPEKQLVGFKKVHVMAGSRQRVRMNIHLCKHLSVSDEFGIRRIPMGTHTLHIGDEIKHQLSLEVDLGNTMT